MSQSLGIPLQQTMRAHNCIQHYNKEGAADLSHFHVQEEEV